MAKRRRKRRAQSRGGFMSQLSQGTKRGLLFILLLATGVLMILSAFQLAGIAGGYIDQTMALLFGWTRLVAALALMLFAFGIIMPNSERVTPWTYVGGIVFFLGLTGMIDLFTLKNIEMSDKILAASGGYLGLVVQQLGTMTVGFWGTFVVACTFLAGGLILMLHASWEDLSLLLGSFRREKEDVDEEEPFEEFEEEADSEEDVTDEDTDQDAIEPIKKGGRLKALVARAQKGQEETVLMTKRVQRTELPLSLLEDRVKKPDSGNIKKNTEIIEKTFADFGIEVEVLDVAIGPTITQYALRPAHGIKIARIVALQNDLALALAAHPIRIEAPIPGRSLVGIEVPNKSIAPVSLRSLIESEAFKKADTDLTFALGMDVTGKAWVAGLEKAPHLLVAGATGSGKSVCLNNIIVSLLYQHGPDKLKFIMVDPKRVELPAYTGIPHLLVPPITKSDDAINALKWTVREMERRLDVLSLAGMRNIADYNKKHNEQMPYIVFVIDELADLMSQASRDVEALIVRIAQMARAVGIHLVLATQRPSVDVITGTIKANIPTRIAFAVASQTDSRTILDYAGAEKLLGRGDMLFMSPSLSKARRMQGAFLSDKEIKAVVKALKDETVPDYNYDITEGQKNSQTALDAENSDALLEDALEAVLASGKASTSLLQRRLKIGYSRAARIMDILEDRGAISAQEGSKPREVLISSVDELYDNDIETEDEPHGVFGEEEEMMNDDDTDTEEDGDDEYLGGNERFEDEASDEDDELDEDGDFEEEGTRR
ncbi:TPA: hypothetical protein DEB00_03435 [Candidatus Uhrbacteria bacterium]|nr:hypothetical protein [Candidatus Uhrbacteria bacterium]